MQINRVCGVILTFILLAFSPALQAKPDTQQVLALAGSAGQWLIEQGQPQDDGVAWPADKNKPETVSYDLASGTAGVVVYFLALHAATGDDRYLDSAAQGGDYLAAMLRNPESFGTGARRSSLYAGIAGVGVALELLAEVRPEFAAEAARVVALLDEWQVATEAGVHWSDDFNDLIYGDAGTALFLAWYAQRNDDQRAMDLALAASRALLEQAQAADSGRYWLFRRSKPFNLPGFSHGTAGIAYVLGTVGDLTNEAALTEAAADGFAYLESIAEIEGERIRIPYGWPAEHWEGLYEFGWAHGLVGSNVFFQRLQQLGIHASDAAKYNSLIVNTLASIGLPGAPDEPFAEPSTPLDWRFGRAAVMVQLSESDAGGDTRDAIWRQLADATSRSGESAYWEVDAPEFMGGGRAAFTGIFHGSAGIGLALLRLHAALLEKEPYVSLPDDPHAWTR